MKEVRRTLLNKKFFLAFAENCGDHVFMIIITDVAFLVGFVVGFVFIYLFVQKPMTEDQFQACETVAQMILEEDEAIEEIPEIPEGLAVDQTGTQIDVHPSNIRYEGGVKAYWQNGELVIERYTTKAIEIYVAIVMGVIFAIISYRAMSRF